MIDSIGVIIILGLSIVALTFIFKRELLDGWGWPKQFAVGASLYIIFSSFWYAIMGDFFWNDTQGFYRLVLALGALVYVGAIADNYGIKFNKKKNN